MKKKAAIKHYGTQRAISEALGISPQAVCKWGEYVPFYSACQLERLTEGAIKVRQSDYGPGGKAAA